MHIYTYVIAFDDGSAPNYDPPAVTLAICKPSIRRTAQLGDVVVAFEPVGHRRRPHVVRWAGIVSEKPSFSDYWHDPRFIVKRPTHSQRPDNIYQPRAGRLKQQDNPAHDSGNVKTDLSGKFVLVFERAWVFGDLGPTLPEHFGWRMDECYRQGHRKRVVSQTKFEKLAKWLDEHREAYGTRLPEYSNINVSGCKSCADGVVTMGCVSPNTC